MRALKMKTKILSGWRSFFHQYEQRTKTVFSPYKRKLLESMSCPLLLFKIKTEQNKTNKQKRNQKEKGGRSLNKAVRMQHHLKESDGS